MKFSIIAVLALANTIVAANPVEARTVSVVDTVHQLYGQAAVNALTNKIIAAIKTAKATAATVGARDQETLPQASQTQITNNVTQIVFEIQAYDQGLLLSILDVLNQLLQGLEGLVAGIVGLVGGVIYGVFGAVGGVLGLLFQILFGWAAPQSSGSG
ncbi:hypothetical protein CSAL01_08038 [Colletotrichum salicis]|uniref:Uncharacterized protein n=1 Tax=Colletotrichum salicis TaxID=1209931 RepID=A0A135T5R0_9PEZI|nr:hypothetical protein CSAL01_08038 [Colletotrichum salicis]